MCPTPDFLKAGFRSSNVAPLLLVRQALGRQPQKVLRDLTTTILRTI